MASSPPNGMKIHPSWGLEVTDAPTTAARGGLHGLHDPLAKVAFDEGWVTEAMGSLLSSTIYPQPLLGVVEIHSRPWIPMDPWLATGVVPNLSSEWSDAKMPICAIKIYLGIPIIPSFFFMPFSANQPWIVVNKIVFWIWWNVTWWNMDFPSCPRFICLAFLFGSIMRSKV